MARVYKMHDIIVDVNDHRRQWRVLWVGKTDYCIQSLFDSKTDYSDVNMWGHEAAEVNTDLLYASVGNVSEMKRGRVGWCGHSYEGKGPHDCGQDTEPEKSVDAQAAARNRRINSLRTGDTNE